MTALLLVALCLASDGGGPRVTPVLERHAHLTVINDGPGDQRDAHVWGDWIAYSSERPGGSELRFHNLATGWDAAASEVGAMDFVTDFKSGLAVVTRLTPTGSSIALYHAGGRGPPSEVASQPGSNRRGAALGGNTLVWQDYGFSSSLLEPELVAYDLQSHALTRLTSDDLLDKDASVSPDGSAVVWTKCGAGSAGCAIWRALFANGGWTSQALTGGEGEAHLPGTNGSIVAYASIRGSGASARKTLRWQPLQGGPEQVLDFPGESTNPILRGDFLAFEHRDLATAVSSWDLYLLDLREARLYRLTDSAVNEALEDVGVSADGLVRVVFAAGAGDDNLFALSFRPRSSEPPTRQSLRLSEQRGDQEFLLKGASVLSPSAGRHLVVQVPSPSAASSGWNCSFGGGAGQGLGFLTVLLWGARRREDP